MRRNSDEKKKTPPYPDHISTNNDGEFYNKDTGEVYGKTVPQSEINAAHSLGFFKLFGSGVNKIANIANAPVRILMYLISNMNPKNNICKCTQEDMAKYAEISRKHVSDVLYQMEMNGVVFCGRGFYQVSPDVVWLGGEQNRIMQLAIYAKKKRKKFEQSKPRN